MYSNGNYWTRGSNSVQCPLYRHIKLKQGDYGGKMVNLKVFDI